jgi:chorismate dehydratase
MGILRIGAVSYLNARPLVVGLERRRDRFAVRYDLPSTCAQLLHAREIDLGLIPSIEYLRGSGYAIVPDCAVASDGPVLSVAIFTKVPIDRVRSMALDLSSRTSVALTRVMTAKYFGIAPTYLDEGPDLERMVTRADAALLIGDPALFADYERLGLAKIDLGHAWKDFTGLPFVYACWVGLAGALGPQDVAALQQARAEGASRPGEVAAAFFADDPARAAIGGAYLRDNIRFRLGDREQAGLERFFALAAEVGVVPRNQPLRWFP